MLLPLRLVSEGVEPAWLVQGENAVEMIELMLQQFGHWSLELHRHELAFHVRVTQRRPISACHAHQQIREREAVVPDMKVFRPNVRDLRIYHRRPKFPDLDEHHSYLSANLRGRQCPTHVVFLPRASERIPQVVGK